MISWWPFGKKKSIGESGIMAGLTDWHSHVLPGVDDGVRHLDESLLILDRLAQLGVGRLWLTPHVMEDVPNTPTALRERFATVFAQYQAASPAIELRLAAENMLDNLFDTRLEEGNVLPIGRDGDHLLVETSYFTPPSDFYDKIKRTFAAGFYPVLAHPERYVYMERHHYRRLLDMGVKFQLNLYSLTGMYGLPAQKKAQDLLSRGAYTLLGTDTHRLSQLEKALAAPCLSSSQISAIEKIKANNYV